MESNLKLILSISTLILLSACGKNVPECGDKKVTDVIINIKKQLIDDNKDLADVKSMLNSSNEPKLKEMQVNFLAAIDEVKLRADKSEFTSVVTKSVDKESGQRTCEASIKTPTIESVSQLFMKMNNGFNETKSIEYTVNVADDGKQLLVKVRGL